MTRRNVFTIAPGAPFLKTFVNAFLSGEIVDSVSRASPPLALARTTIFVPTQRAGRALAAQFAQEITKGATFLPKILPLGGLEEFENVALFDAEAGGADYSIPAAIEELERRLLLAQLILQWSQSISHAIVSIDLAGAPVCDESEPFLVASTPSGAYALAKELGALIDEFIIEGVRPDAVDALVEGAYDEFWAITTKFLRVALAEWPAILAERELVDAAARGKRLIEQRIDSLRENMDGAPVIAIGSTGAQPVTARLLAAIVERARGAVVLPGLDQEMAEDAWSRVGDNEDEPAFTHPQTVLKRLLGTMKLKRKDVLEIGQMTEPLAARRRLVSEAMAPADTTSSWRNFRAEFAAHFPVALERVTIIVAPDEREEALSLALAMREALESPRRTAALVTPDRNLARRVAIELKRFDIDIDDSGGAPLALSAAGELARLIASIGVDGFNAVNAAALLTHPLACFGRARGEVEALAPLVEIAVLRAPISAEGLSASLPAARLLASARHAHPAARRIEEAQWIQIDSLLQEIEVALAPSLAARSKRALADFAAAHRASLEAATRGSSETDDAAASRLYALFDRLETAEAPADFDAASYASLFDRIAFETVLRQPRRGHPRLKILGPLEARLLDADLVLLAGLDEGVWPPQADTGAFLNRSMRNALGLPPPERRISQSAHDFVMALGAEEVVLSRAMKRDGSPMTASRFLTRLDALAGDALEACRRRGARLLHIANALDNPGETVTITRPTPRPPVEMRPVKLSVTRIERLRRDPYAIFAEYVLKLVPLAPLGAEAGAREIGTAIHEALAKFSLRHPSGALPLDARGELHDLAQLELAEFLRDPAFLAFTWPRIVEGLDHALGFESERRALARQIFIETSGSWRFPLADGSQFTLTAIADRIEVDHNDRAHVFDYKTGSPPTKAQVKAGWSPQLTLEAAMIEVGAFSKIGAHPVEGAAYVGLKNGGVTRWLDYSETSFGDLVDAHRVQLVEMLSQFRNAGTPYSSRPHVAFLKESGDYDHLARVKEWSRGGGDSL